MSRDEAPVSHADAIDYAVHLHDVATRLHERGDTAGAMTTCRTSLVILEAECGHTHPDVANVLLSLGEIHEDLGEYDAAQQCYDRAEAITRGLPLDDDALTRLRVQALVHVGGIHRVRGRLAAADLVLRDAVHAARQHLGGHDVEVATACNALGMVCKYAARYTEGEALYRRALQVLESSGLGESLLAASVYHNLGGLEHAQGRYVTAEPYARRAVELRQRALGPDDPAVAADVAALAAIVDGQGRHDEAEALYRRAATVFEHAYGADHYELAVTAHNLGVLAAARGDVAEAQRCYERALASKRALLGDVHFDVAITLHNLAGVLEDRGRAGDARRLYTEAMDIFVATLPADHPHTAACRQRLVSMG